MTDWRAQYPTGFWRALALVPTEFPLGDSTRQIRPCRFCHPSGSKAIELYGLAVVFLCGSKDVLEI